jgi:hypothetical protein|eukprot:COSAG01_NODE_1279_length_10929_cov_4.549492_5_plen_31_part_00
MITWMQSQLAIDEMESIDEEVYRRSKLHAI